jgi:hypothetical protein
MVRPPHDLPGIAVIVDVASPCKRLEADADSVPRRPFAEFVEVGGSPVDAAERHRRQIGADEDQVGAEFAHQFELALGTSEGAAAMRFGHALEIPEGLETRGN